MSKTTSYVPGPWEENPTGFELFIMAEDVPIAETLWPERASGDIGSVRRANARLIAAAPEMFELLKRMRCSICGPNTPHSPAINAIIAKVEGNEQEEKRDDPG